MSAHTLEFVGLNTSYPTADGSELPRLHLDGAASPLASKVALQSITELLPHYSNTHSRVHASAQISTEAFHWAHDKVLEFLAANEEEFTAVFAGSGSTAAINRVARGLRHFRPDRPIVLVSAMEHHANDLPHRHDDNDVHYLPLTGEGARAGSIDLQALENLLKEHKGKVNYITLSAVSNVTGIINPVDEICELAHRHDTLVVVDAAQAVAHQKIEISKPSKMKEIDFLIFSGHKIYCPTAPGVLIARKSLLAAMQGQDLGGGAVNDVSYFNYELADLPDREQAGTPNIVGAIALGRVLESLQNYGRQRIETHAIELLSYLQNELLKVPGCTVYGDQTAPRIGALAFNLDGIDHGLLGAILNDYYAIAVRNECFCAHPYVSSMLKEALWQLNLDGIRPEQQQAFINSKRGMVRASLSAYNSAEDVDRLVGALRDIQARIGELSSKYTALADGNYRHNTFSLDWREELGW